MSETTSDDRADARGVRVLGPPRHDRIMAVAAHPDDIESWCAGTLARAIAAGGDVRLLLVTSGDKGSADPDADPAAVAALREAEARAAAARLGLAEVAFLRHPDGEVEDTRVLRGQIVACIRRWKPEALFTHDPERPWPPYLAHRDHRIVGRAALDAAYPLARDPLSFPEHCRDGLPPHAASEVWLFASAVADVYVDISAGFERKIAARLAHVSQTPDPDALAPSWRKRAAAIGTPARLPLAEAFIVLPLDEGCSSSAAQGVHDGLDVGPHHPHVALAGAAFGTEGVGVERRRQRDPRFGGDGGHQVGVGDVFGEDGRHASRLDLRDEPDDLLCRGVGGFR